ncbi:MAG: TIGR01777 family oxidoreductase [Pseudomonadota bacterium]
MHILVTGGTGFIGTALVPALLQQQHAVSVLTRQLNPDIIDGAHYERELANIVEPVDAVINLAGASLAGQRWSPEYKEEMRSSRIEFTRQLGSHFAASETQPSVWVNASAIGFYGASLDQGFTEEDAPGSGFSAQLCNDWEAAAADAAGDARLCLLRLGVVLDAGGGAFVEMSRSFRLGMASWMGTGQQFLSWIHRHDAVAAILRLLDSQDASGVFNLTAPGAVTSREFCSTLRRYYRTLVALPVPALALRLLVGEMANELLLTGQRVAPTRLEELAFEFAYPDIDDAVKSIRAVETASG